MELTLKQKRVMMYFIEATEKIISEEGIEKVSIKKIAELAGYNSATLYNYFENLEVLILYASVHYLKIYLRDLKESIRENMSAMEMYITVYKMFVYHSFQKPEIFYTLFFGKYSHKLDKVIRKYYEIFPEEYEGQNALVKAILSNADIYKRDLPLIEVMVKEGSLDAKEAPYIMESIVRTHHSYLLDLVSRDIEISVEEHSKAFFKIFYFLLKQEEKEGKK